MNQPKQTRKKTQIQSTTSTHPDKEIDHESNVECEVNLLRGVLVIRDAVLDLNMMMLRITIQLDDLK